MVAFAAISMTSFAQNYTLKGDVMELLKQKLEGTTIYITNPQSGRQVDSAKVVNGQFEFRGKVLGSDSVCLIAFGANRSHFILQPGNIVYDGKTDTYSGTKLNDILKQYKEETGDFRREIMPRYQALQNNTTMSEAEKNKEGMKLNREYMGRASEVTKKYIMANKDNALNALLIEGWLQHGDDVKKFDEAMSMAGDYAKNYRPLTREIPRMEALRKVQTGMPFVDFTVPKGNLDGSDVSFSDYIGKGKWVLVDFWASWCGPCRGEIPNLKAAYEKYHNQGLELLSVACWDKEPNTRKALEEEKMPWPQIINANDIATKAYGIIGIPQIILFAPDGRIAAKGLRGTMVDETVARMLADKAVITGKAEGVADGSKVTLYENGNFMEKETNRVLTETTVKNGEYRIEYNTIGVVRVGFVSTEKASAGLIIEPGNIRLDLPADQKVKAYATGTPLNEGMKRYEEDSRALMAEMGKATEGIDMSDYNIYLKKANEARAQFKQPAKEMYERHLRPNMGNALGDYVLYFYTMSTEPKEAVKMLDERGGDDYLYRPLIGFAKKLRASSSFNVGDMFRDFTVEDGNPDGTKVSLSDYVGKGKVVLVDFWASWCGWCRRETPNLKTVYEKYKNRNFTVLGLAIQDEKEATLKAIAEDKPTWPQIFNCGDTPTKVYGINGIPQIMLFDADGTLLARDLRGQAILDAVDTAMIK